MSPSPRPLALNPALARIGQYPMLGQEALKRRLAEAGKQVFDFGIGDPVEETPAFIREAALQALSPRSQYPTVLGRPPLREAAAGYLARRFNVRVDPATQVLHTAGSKEAIFHLPLALIDPQSERRVVVAPDPGYAVYEHGAQLAGGVCHKVPLTPENHFRIEPDALPREVLERTALFWVCYPHNPTGAVADRAYYQRVCAAAEQYGFVVGSDECYVDLYFGARPPSVLEVSQTRTLAFHSCSKRSGMTGYRSGFMAGDPSLITALTQLRPFVGTASPNFIQDAAAVAWAEDAHAEARRALFGRKRQRMMDFFQRRGLDCSWSQGTFYLWVRVPAGHTSQSYTDLLAPAGIIVSPGPLFGKTGEGFFRLALVPSEQELEEAIAAWP